MSELALASKYERAISLLGTHFNHLNQFGELGDQSMNFLKIFWQKIISPDFRKLSSISIDFSQKKGFNKVGNLLLILFSWVCDWCTNNVFSLACDMLWFIVGLWITWGDTIEEEFCGPDWWATDNNPEFAGADCWSILCLFISTIPLLVRAGDNKDKMKMYDKGILKGCWFSKT